jgi:hypothetical protein
MKIELDLNDQVFDSLLKQTLIRDYYGLNDDISNHYEQFSDIEPDNVPNFDVINLNNNIKFRDALEIVLEYYLTHEEYKEKVLEINV